MVCSVNVANHASTISPSLKAGKDVYVEWPLGKSLADAEGLLNLKNKYGVKLANVGLQAREAPMVHKAKQLIADGKIGTVLSSTWSAAGLQLGGDSLGESMAYFSKKDVGGNLLTIHFGHAIDYVQAGGSCFCNLSIFFYLLRGRMLMALLKSSATAFPVLQTHY